MIWEGIFAAAAVLFVTLSFYRKARRQDVIQWRTIYGVNNLIDFIRGQYGTKAKELELVNPYEAEKSLIAEFILNGPKLISKRLFGNRKIMKAMKDQAKKISISDKTFLDKELVREIIANHRERLQIEAAKNRQIQKLNEREMKLVRKKEMYRSKIEAIRNRPKN
jgi:hypothetical protein